MKLLIRGTNWVGDAVMSVPAMRMLKSNLPNAQISLLTGSWARDVFQDADFIDELIVLEKDHTSIRGTLRQAKILRDRGFQSTIIFPNSFHSAVLAQLSGIPRRVGFAAGGRSIFLSHSVKVPEWKHSRHESLLYIELVHRFFEASGMKDVDSTVGEPMLGVSEERLRQARVRLSESGVDLARPVVALGVGSQNSRAKRWQSSGFAELADMLSKRLGASVVILGSAAEKSVADEVVAASESKPINLAGITGLSEATAIIAAADLYIGNDMGLTHISPAVGTETIAIFGPTNDVATRPLSDRAFVLRKYVDCSPCMLRDCPIDHRCMTQITAEEVFETARIRIGGSSA
jgi:heptosyltransferase-2